LKDNPMTSRVVPISRLQHSMKRLHREEGLVILDDESRVHLLPFVGLNDWHHAAKPSTTTHPTAFWDISTINLSQYFGSVCSDWGLTREGRLFSMEVFFDSAALDSEQHLRRPRSQRCTPLHCETSFPVVLAFVVHMYSLEDSEASKSLASTQTWTHPA
jgi:hypothetical protein